MKILYVEDEIIISNLAKMIFMKTDHVLVVCPSVSGARKILNREVIELVILDMNFPKSNGMELLEYIDQNSIKTKVIVYSGFIEKYEKSLKPFIESGIITGVFVKPTHQLLEIISSIEVLTHK